jgi:UDP-GlcNAc3NAcA epimerase
VKNLQKEGIRDKAAKIVRNVGDVMYDSVLYYSKIAEQKSTILEDFNLFNPQSAIRHAPRRVHGCPEPLMVQGEPRTPNYYLATLHRAENTDHPKRLKSILRGLNEIAKDLSVILPLHPRTKKMVEVYRLGSAAKKIKLVEPVSYLNMLKLEKNARAIFTDSGGVQKEAYWFRVPCFTLRNETEWVETLESGWNTLVGTGMRIAEEVRREIRRKRPLGGKKIFGDGKASEKIVELLMNVKVEHSRR